MGSNDYNIEMLNTQINRNILDSKRVDINTNLMKSVNIIIVPRNFSRLANQHLHALLSFAYC